MLTAELNGVDTLLLSTCVQLACRKREHDSTPTCSCFNSPLRSKVSLIAAIA
jgi:hypothetical protein